VYSSLSSSSWQLGRSHGHDTRPVASSFQRKLYSSSAPSHFSSAAPSFFPSDDDDEDDDDIDDGSNSREEVPTFASLTNLHPSSLHALTHKFKISTMTEIQHKTFDAASQGRDVLGRARTGTGKTLAFLLPALESALGNYGRIAGPHGYQVTSPDDAHTKTGGIAILILSPTRELAMQIHNQAQVLLSSHRNTSAPHDDDNENNILFDGKDGSNKDRTNHNAKASKTHQHALTSQVMFGGSSRNNDLQRLEQSTPFILVATPGRLIDHMKNSHVRGVPIADIVGNVSVLVLDEADRCLDMGFRPDMEWILNVLNDCQKKKVVHQQKQGTMQQQQQQNQQQLHGQLPMSIRERQTLLFSATVPKDLRSVMASALRPEYLTVDCIHDVDPSTFTNAHVNQTYVTLPSLSSHHNAHSDDPHLTHRYLTTLIDILQDILHIQNPHNYKIIVFFPTTTLCRFFSHIFNHIYKVPVIEIHSQKSQSNRTYTSNLFRKWNKGVLFTTDVSARGVDYPDVTHVIQFGGAESRETYIHRLGRTGRAGKIGRGLIVCCSKGEEKGFVKRELEGLEVGLDGRYQRMVLGREEEDGVAVIGEEDGVGDASRNAVLNRRRINQGRIQKIRSSIANSTDAMLRDLAEASYRGLLGYYLGRMKLLGMSSKEEVVQLVNEIAMQMGFERGDMPSLQLRVARNLGLVGVRGLNIEGSGGRSGGPGGSDFDVGRENGVRSLRNGRGSSSRKRQYRVDGKEGDDFRGNGNRKRNGRSTRQSPREESFRRWRNER